MTILYLVFGNKTTFHVQTYFGILTALRYKSREDNVVLYTDAPEYYARLKDHIEIQVFDEVKLTEWMAGRDYIFRAKIKAIEECCELHPDQPLIFADGDTVFTKSLTEMGELLSQGKGIMYADEGHPSKMKRGSLRMWKALKGKQFGDCIISEKHNVWNSGIIGIPTSWFGKITPLALQICDAVVDAKANCFTAEQYAFSVAMQEAGELKSAQPWVIHYWGNKEQWNAMAKEYLVRAHLQGWTVAEEISSLGTLPLDTLPVHIYKSNTQRRLTNMVQKLFPNRIIK